MRESPVEKSSLIHLITAVVHVLLFQNWTLTHTQLSTEWSQCFQRVGNHDGCSRVKQTRYGVAGPVDAEVELRDAVAMHWGDDYILCVAGIYPDVHLEWVYQGGL